MKYESEILYDLMKRDGLLNPSQNNLPYESELKEEYIDSVKGAYPKLTDYQAEWLNYAYNEQPIGAFPYNALSDVTNATIENVVPYAYKSAILKGNTLVNLCDKTKSVISEGGNKNIWRNALFNTNPTQLTVINYTDKVIKFAVHKRTTNDWVSTNGVKANSKLLVNCGTDKYLKDLYGAYGDGWSNTEEDRNILKDGILILEGDHTQEDIPYFEGMKSVQMPVLTTTGKNLCDCDFELGSVDWDTGVKINNDNVVRNTSPIKVDGGDTIYITGKTKHAKDCKYIFEYDENMNFIHRFQNDDGEALVLHEATRYINMRSCDQSVSGDDYVMLPLNEYKNAIMVSNTPTSYEPYKSNILTVNEEVEFRGIGEVKDTLDCLTGELTQRIGEVVLDGSEKWYADGVYFYHNSLKPKNKNIIGDKIKVDKNKNTNPTSTVATFSGGGNLEIFVQGVSTKDEFLNWLSVNKPRFVCELANESVKTVDLTITNQNGESLSKMTPIEGTMNLTTSSDTIAPTFSGEIPVEAITQNLESFIEE